MKQNNAISRLYTRMIGNHIDKFKLPRLNLSALATSIGAKLSSFKQFVGEKMVAA